MSEQIEIGGGFYFGTPVIIVNSESPHRQKPGLMIEFLPGVCAWHRIVFMNGQPVWFKRDEFTLECGEGNR